MNTPTKTALETIKDLLSRELEVGLEASEIKDNQPLLDGGLGLDSLAVVELVFLLEETLSVQFTEEELQTDNFLTVERLAKLVESRL